MQVLNDGRHIDRYIPRDLRGMFYRNLDSRSKYRVVDGYDPYGFSTEGLVLYLPLWALKDSAFKSVDAYKTTATVNGTVTWLPNGRDFPGTDDYLTLPATATQLNFTSGNFSIIMRVKFDVVDAHQVLYCRGLGATDGWYIMFNANTKVYLYTSQVDADQNTRSTASVTSTTAWYTIGFSRSGEDVLIYIDGAEDVEVAGTHINPVTCARTTKIGCYDDLSLDFNGTMSDIFVYNRSLSAGEHLDIHKRLSWRV